MKTLAIFVGALVFGFVGGILGQRFSSPRIAPELTSFVRSHSFELIDSSGRVVSIWTVDRWGRPYLGMSDAKWEGRLVIGSIGQGDVVSNEGPDPGDPWGISVTAPGHEAHAMFGTSTPLGTNQPIGFIALRNGSQMWTHDGGSKR